MLMHAKSVQFSSQRIKFTLSFAAMAKLDDTVPPSGRERTNSLCNLM